MTAVVRTSVVNKAVESFVDPGNLLIIDRDPLGFDNKKNFIPPNEDLLKRTRDNTQSLINEIWKLPRSTFENATCAELPRVRYILPREKPVPHKSPLTRWQKFAQSKGIKTKNNRDKKVWDEESETWKPRYGYNRGSDNTKEWLIEIPENKDPNVDYFAERNNAKKERVAKNQLQQLKNVKRRLQEEQKSQNDGLQQRRFNNQNLTTPRAISGANSIPLGVTTDPKDRNKTELGFKIHHAKQATASAGKFQEKLKSEKTPKLGIKRKFEPNEQNVEEERKRQLAILDRMVTKKSKINQSKINAAAEASFQNDKRQGSR